MTGTILLWLYGGIVIASCFLIGSMGRLAAKEFAAVGPFRALRSTYFWLAANLCGQAVALSFICGIRTLDGLRGVDIEGSWPWGLIAGFALLFVSKIGFNWAGSLELKHGKAIWRSFLASLLLWLIFVLARNFLSA
jgi:hypothetical protein